MEAVVILLLFAAFCSVMALLCIRAKWRDARKGDEASQQFRSKVNQVEVTCDADGNVTVVTDDPSRVRVERRS